MLKRFSIDFVFSVGVNLAVVAIGAVISILLARYWGPEVYGEYIAAFAMGALVASLTNLGLNKLVLRDVVDNSLKSRQALASLLLDKIGLVFVGALVSLVLFGAGQQFQMLQVSEIFIWLALASILTGITDFIRTTIWSRSRVGLSNILRIAEKLILVLFVLIFISSGSTLDEFVIGLVLVSISTLLVTTIVWFKVLPLPVFGKDTIQLARQSLIQTLPIGMWAFLVAFYFRIDTLIIAALRPSAEVGWYSVAYTLIQLLASLALIFTNLIMPLLSRERSNDASFEKIYRMSIVALTLSGFIIAFWVVSIGPELIGLVYGSEFLQSGASLRLFAYALPALFLVSILTTLLLISHGQNYLAKIAVINLATTTALDLALIPYWGFIGATIATTLAETVGVGLHLVYLRRMPIGFSLPKKFISVSIVGFIILTTLIFFPRQDIILAILGTIAFLGYAFGIDFIDSTERNLLHTVFPI